MSTHRLENVRELDRTRQCSKMLQTSVHPTISSLQVECFPAWVLHFRSTCERRVRIVLQASRGNLETIVPRRLVTSLVVWFARRKDTGHRSIYAERNALI